MELTRRLMPASAVDDAEVRARRILDDVAPADEPGVRRAIRCLDLTSLGDDDDDSSARALTARAKERSGGERVAAVCTWGPLIPVVVGSVPEGVAVASVAGGFPGGTVPLDQKVAEIEAAVAAGADEIDVVIDRRNLLEGRPGAVFDEVERFRSASAGARLKVIIESGEMRSLELVRLAALTTLEAGADLVKTSTGKTEVGATPGAALTIAEAVRDFVAASGRRAGVKISGGIRSVSDANGYMALVASVLGDEALEPWTFRIGASSLLDDLVKVIGR